MLIKKDKQLKLNFFNTLKENIDNVSKLKITHVLYAYTNYEHVFLMYFNALLFVEQLNDSKLYFYLKLDFNVSDDHNESECQVIPKLFDNENETIEESEVDFNSLSVEDAMVIQDTVDWFVSELKLHLIEESKKAYEENKIPEDQLIFIKLLKKDGIEFSRLPYFNCYQFLRQYSKQNKYVLDLLKSANTPEEATEILELNFAY